MLTFLNKPRDKEEILQILNPLVKEWFFSKFKELSLPQLYCVNEIHERNNILISAPTGGTKTLTAFLSIINELVNLSESNYLQDQIYAIYISPLKALASDVYVNLEKPLQEIEKLANKKLGIRVAARTGDTKTSERQKMLKKPPHIFITTPESLAILLSSYKFRELFKNTKYIIIDEIHALAENKRGVHLSLSLERLQYLSPNLKRIGLSATVSPIEEIAKFLVGERECKIADIQFTKKYDLKVISPLPDLINTTQSELHRSLYNLLDNLIQEHKTTLIFTNTRSGTERVVHHLKEKFPKKYVENIGAHHGSLSKEHRLRLEERLRKGELKAVVCLEGSTKILNSNGDWIKIKDIGETNVQSLNKELKLTDNKIITKITKANKESLLKLKTSLGKEIICTKEHKFLTISKEGNLDWKEAQSITENDFVATIRNYNYQRYTKNELDFICFNNYSEDGYVQLNKAFLGKIKNNIKIKFGKIKSFWENNIKSLCAYSTLLHSLRGKYLFRVEIIKKICDEISINKLELYKNIIYVSSGNDKMPKIVINNDFMRLLGFMSAEGYISNRSLFVSNKNKILLDYYSNLIKKLSNKKAGFKLGSTGTPILIWESTFLSKLLKNCGFKIGRKARINSIPHFMFRLDSKLVFSFLSGYFDGDGFSEIKSKNNRLYAAGFSTTSKTMAEDISRLLIREGITSSIRSRYYDEIQEYNNRKIIKKGWFYDVALIGGEHIRKFAKQIDPKRDNLKRVKELLDLNGYCNIDIIPNIGNKLKELRHNLNLSTYILQKEKLNPIKYELGTRNIGRKQLTKLLSKYKCKDSYLINLPNSDLFWEKIKSKNIVEQIDSVYNLEVEKNHNYIANGFLTKNCSTSLELGIDIGYIDLVVCLGSPKSVARFLQRAGRAGHSLHETVKGRIVVLDRDDLVECSVLLKSAIEKKIDNIHIPKNSLDVLAQQIFGMAIEQPWNLKEILQLIKKSYCYKDLKTEDFMEVIKYLAGEYTKLEDRHIYAKIWYDKNTNMIGKKGRLARVLYMTNIGTIPDETSVLVKINNEVIGRIEEGFLEKLKPKDIFVLGGNTYEFRYSRGMTAQVRAAYDRTPTVPYWYSEVLPLSFDLSQEISRFRRNIEDLFVNKKSKKQIIDYINKTLYVDENASKAIYTYMREQYLFAEIPHLRKLLVEQYQEENKKYVIFHSLNGRRVNDVLSRALAYAIAKIQHRDVEVGISDNGFYLASKKPIQALRAFDLLKPEELEDVMKLALERTEVFKRRFRHCAIRALMILRQYKGVKNRVGRQQVSSMILLSAVKRISNDFSILKETRREILEDLMDIKNSKQILKDIKDKRIIVKQINNTIPSPFAFNLMSQAHTDILKMEDKLEFLKRMHQQVLTKIGKSHIL